MMSSTPLSKRLLRQKRFRQLILILIVLALVIGVVIVPVEQNALDQQIINAFDGIYWAVTTFTTVGYGDIVPVTVTGRTLAMMLQIIGAIFFGIIIAMISSYINRAQDEFYWNRLFKRLDRLEDELADIKKQSTFLVKNEPEENLDD